MLPSGNVFISDSDLAVRASMDDKIAKRKPSQAMDQLWKQKHKPGVRLESKPVTTFNLVHNPLHDLESVWWLFLYVFATREITGESESWNRDKQKNMLDLAFPPIPYGGKRHMILTNANEFKKLTDTFEERVRACHIPLDSIRAALLLSFAEFEKHLPAVNSASWEPANDLHTEFIFALRGLI